MQLEPKKNMLETLLRDNLEQRREELKKVSLGGWVRLECSLVTSPPLCCVSDVGVHLSGRP